MNNQDFTFERKPLPAKISTIGFVLTGIGIVLALLSYIVDPTRAAFNNIIGFMFLMGLGLCSLFLVALEYISGAVWSVPFRRINEFLAPLLIIAPILAIPVLFHMHDVFHWAHHEAVELDPILKGKSAYLNFEFFLIRLGAVALIMSVFYLLLIRNSGRQDITKDVKHTKANIRLSAVFIPFFGISITALAVDWLMSVEPHWFSTIFGIYYFTGSLLSAFAVLTYIAVKLYENGYLPKQINLDHFYNLGAYSFAFINFWAYIAFSQFMLIWYANLPEETYWFINKSEGTWLYMSIGLIFIHFIIPYGRLLSQPSKSNLKALKFMALWIVFARFYDLFWLIMPTYSRKGIAFSWFELAFPILAIGIVILVFAYVYKRRNLIPVGDPKLQRGLDFHL